MKTKLFDKTAAQIDNDTDPSVSDQDRIEMHEVNNMLRNVTEQLVACMRDMPPEFAMVVLSAAGREILGRVQDERKENLAAGNGPHGPDCKCDVLKMDESKFVKS